VLGQASVALIATASSEILATSDSGLERLRDSQIELFVTIAAPGLPELFWLPDVQQPPSPGWSCCQLMHEIVTVTKKGELRHRGECFPGQWEHRRVAMI
jgi:hypothetical protein